MGGNGIAEWDGSKIYVMGGRPHGRSDQTVIRALRKIAGPEMAT